jgi:hypothetical protein
MGNEYGVESVRPHGFKEGDKEFLLVSDIVKKPAVSRSPHQAGITLPDVEEVDLERFRAFFRTFQRAPKGDAGGEKPSAWNHE